MTQLRRVAMRWTAPVPAPAPVGVYVEDLPYPGVDQGGHAAGAVAGQRGVEEVGKGEANEAEAEEGKEQVHWSPGFGAWRGVRKYGKSLGVGVGGLTPESPQRRAAMKGNRVQHLAVLREVWGCVNGGRGPRYKLGARVVREAVYLTGVTLSY